MTAFVPDRLGSVGKFYPYGVERNATANGTEKFATYFRDSETGLDYADQRYESPGTGRFLTPDRLRGRPSDPGSWNKYAYTRGDPINRFDPRGLAGFSLFLDNGDASDANGGEDSDEDLGFTRGGGAGGGGGLLLPPIVEAIDNDLKKAQDYFPDAKKLAAKALSVDSCKTLLTGNGNLDPATVLNGIFGTLGKYVTVEFSPSVQAVAGTSGNWWSLRYAFGQGWYYGSVSITINDTTYTGGGFPTDGWNTGSDIDRVTILLHELARAMSFLQPGDVNGFGAPDAAGHPDQQKTNKQLIKDRCITPLMNLPASQ